jgi:hypothetical protein
MSRPVSPVGAMIGPMAPAPPGKPDDASGAPASWPRPRPIASVWPGEGPSPLTRPRQRAAVGVADAVGVRTNWPSSAAGALR